MRVLMVVLVHLLAAIEPSWRRRSACWSRSGGRGGRSRAGVR